MNLADAHFLAGVHEGRGVTGEWRAAVAAALREWGLVLEERGLLAWWSESGPGPFGEWAFFEVDEVAAAFGGAPWLERTHACPYVGPLRGFVGLRTWDERPDEVKSLLVAVLKECRGVIVEAGTGVARPAVRERSFSLARAFGKFGFDDGDVFLTREESPYAAYVIETVERALAAQGFDAFVSWSSTCHSNVRLGGFQPNGSERLFPALWRDGALVDPDALPHVDVTIWCLDFDVADALSGAR